MTESEWLTCKYAESALMHLREAEKGRQSSLKSPIRCGIGRKLRLFSAACCRRNWHLLTDDRSREAVQTAERLADGELDHTGADGIREAAYAVYAHTSAPGSGFADAAVGISRGEWEAAHAPAQALREYNNAQEAFRAAMVVSEEAITAMSAIAAEATCTSSGDYLRQEARIVEFEAHVRLLRDIFGNPFRPITFDPRWQSETVVALADGIYAERAFDRMPILADALEEAGCDHADILTHCRDDGPHVRGCWAVDLILGKS